MAKGGAATVLAALAAAALLCLRDPAAAALPRLEHPAKNDESLILLVIGDWGRKGECNQYRVVEQMGRVGEKLDIDFMVSTGDNFYDTGLTGVDDDAFEQSFMDIYMANSLHKPWYLVLGNHDYRGDALAQFSPALRKIDSQFICMRSFIVNTGLGYVARNHLSMVVFSGWTSDSFCSSVEEADNLAALIGIRKALSTFTGPIWVESDCIATVQALNCNTTNRSPSCIFVEETKEILRSFQNFKVTKCHRSANGVAHALGQISRRVFSSCFLSEAVPACVSEALDADCKLAHDEI